MRVSNEKVPFRLLHMPCCHILICWVNPRRPMYCPECGKHVFRYFDRETWERTYSEAWLKIQDNGKAYYQPAPDEHRYPNGAPMFNKDGMMLDDKGNRSIFDDVDE